MGKIWPDDYDEYEPNVCYVCGRTMDGYFSQLCAECRNRAEHSTAAEPQEGGGDE